jgi:hypothetical protein
MRGQAIASGVRLRAQKSLATNRSGAQPDRFTGCLEMEKRLASEDTSPVRFSREESVRITDPKNPGSLKYQLAEGIEPPTL